MLSFDEKREVVFMKVTKLDSVHTMYLVCIYVPSEPWPRPLKIAKLDSVHAMYLICIYVPSKPWPRPLNTSKMENFASIFRELVAFCH